MDDGIIIKLPKPMSFQGNRRLEHIRQWMHMRKVKILLLLKYNYLEVRKMYRNDHVV